MDDRWQGSVVIDRPIEQVYHYLADFPKHCEWAQTLEHMELKRPGDPSGVGAQYLTSERQDFQADRAPRAPITKGMRAKTLCEVRELTPDQRIAWQAHPTPIKMGTHAAIEVDLAPEGEGRTRLTQTIHMHQPGLMFAFFHRFKGVTSEKAHAQWQASLDNVKLILEEDATPVATASVSDHNSSAPIG